MRPITVSIDVTNKYMTLLMDFKPLTFILYFIYLPKICSQKLQIGHRKDDIDCQKEGQNIMNIGYTEITKIYNGSVNLQYNTQFQIYFCATFFHVANTRRLQNCPQDKILNPQNTHWKKFGTHEIPTRKNCGPMKYPQEKI